MFYIAAWGSRRYGLGLIIHWVARLGSDPTVVFVCF